jgi:4-hydroxybenzoate polyprenyltransferase
MNQTVASRLRTLLILGRVSNLPTVWSNCLAAWWLAGAGSAAKLPLLLLGLSALYIGGMFLNDAFDAEFDRQRRAGRPIPSGQISEADVWRYGWGWLVVGVLLLFGLGWLAGALGLVLAGCILVYNQAHKLITASPWLMGLCRFWVYVIAGFTGANGTGLRESLPGWSVWGGMALALYVVGLSYVARRESYRGPVPFWPLLLLSAPFFLAWMMDPGDFRRAALWIALVLGLWVARCVRPVFQTGTLNVGRVVSGLLAGIVLVDWLAVAPECPPGLNVIFLILFGATLALQRYIPAT